MQIAIRYGLLLGLLMILTSVFVYVMGISFATSYWVSFLMFLLWLGGSIFGAWRIKQENKGIINYGQAFSWVMLMIAIAWFMSTVYGYIFNNFIDTEYPALLTKATINKMEEGFANTSLSESQADQIIAETKTSLEETYSYKPIAILKGMLGVFIVGGVFSLLATIFVNRKGKEDDFLYEDDDNFEKKSDNF